MRISDWSSDVCSSDLKGVEDVEDAARGRLAVKLRQRDRIDARQRHEGQETEDDQRPDREPDAVLELGRLTEFRKAEIGCQLVGARGHDVFPRVADRAPRGPGAYVRSAGSKPKGKGPFLAPPLWAWTGWGAVEDARVTGGAAGGER